MTKSIFLNFSILLSIILTTNSCFEDSNTRILPNSSGKHSEILVVADSINWASGAGVLLDSIYLKEYPLLFKKEPFFKLIHFKEKDFSSILKTHQNILFLKKTDTNSIKTFKSLWSKKQHVLEIRYNNVDSISSKIKNLKDELFYFFYNGDLKRQAEKNEEHKLEGVYSFFETNKNLKVVIPEDFSVAEETEDFYWYRREKPHLTESITIFEEDYTNKKQFNDISILEIRDSVSAVYIKGEREASFMTTEYRVPPIIDTIDINGTYGKRTRGWWRLTNDFMGGYFIRYSFADVKRGKMYHIEAFLYCPKYDKMFYLRELESILYSIQVIK